MDRVVVDQRIMNGVPCVRGTRIPVATILGLLGEGLTPADVLTGYPQLVLEDVLACEQYAALHGERTVHDQQLSGHSD